MVQAAAFLTLCLALLLYVYRRYYWERPGARALLFWTLGCLTAAVVAKYAIKATGYIPARMLFYAVAEPRFEGLPWLGLIAASLYGLLVWYRRRQAWGTTPKLLALWLIFVLFAIGVAALRQGLPGIAEPFTRSEWEYISDAQLVRNVPQFLSDYLALLPQLSMHGAGHPPGNALIIYLLQSVFGSNVLVLALLVIMLGGAVVVPVYYFWREFLPEADVETVLPVFMLTPSLVMYAATCMDILTPLFFWMTLWLCDKGWRRGAGLAAAGGVLGGVALLLNFQFLVFAAVLLFFFGRQLLRAAKNDRASIVVRGLASFGGFAAFHLGLFAVTGYSIVENYFAAHAVHYAVVEAGASGIPHYLLFALSNVSGFLIYLGVASCVLYTRTRVIQQPGPAQDLTRFGFVMIAILVISGIYQGEVERLWLFLTPVFVAPSQQALRSSGVPVGAVITLVVFQILALETLFYTYW